MKLIFDFIPLLLFFISFKLYGVFVATLVAVISAMLQMAYQWLKHKHLDSLTLITLILVMVLGGPTFSF